MKGARAGKEVEAFRAGAVEDVPAAAARKRHAWQLPKGVPAVRGLAKVTEVETSALSVLGNRA